MRRIIALTSPLAAALTTLCLTSFVVLDASAQACNVPLRVAASEADNASQAAARIPDCPGNPQIPVPIHEDDAEFVSQSVVTEMVVGQQYPVAITMRNKGFADWTAAAQYNLGAINPYDTMKWGVNRIPTAGIVSQDQQTTYRFTVTAPLDAGRHNFQWRMAHDGVNWFGYETRNLQITVHASLMKGWIDGITNNQITGWACSTRISTPVDVEVYVGGQPGSGTLVGRFSSNQSSEAAVGGECQTSGASHRFAIPIQNSWVTNHSGKTIYIRALSPVGASHFTLNDSGKHKLPVNQKPTVQLTSPATGTIVAEGSNVMLQATAADADDGVASVTFQGNGSNLGQATKSPWQYTWLSIPEGAHTIQAVARDTRGAATTSAARTLYSTRVLGSINAYNGTITGWACSTYWKDSIKIHLYFGGPFGTGTNAGEYVANVATTAAQTSACKSTGTAYGFSIPVTDAMVKTYGGKTIHIHGISPIPGENRLLSNSGTYTLPANKPPVITLTSPANGTKANAPGEFVLQATASDPDDSVTKVVFYRNNTAIATLTQAPYRHVVTGLGAGTHTFHAIATDRRGATARSASASTTVVVGQTPASVTRIYVYDQHQRLCKVIEPETGATVMDYDAAGNLAWSASGLALPSTTLCNRTEALASGRRIDRTYNKLNLPTQIRFPDGNGDQIITYTVTGKPETITTLNEEGTAEVINGYSYNKIGLLTGESMRSKGRNELTIGYGHDMRGNLQSQKYPSGSTITYSNNVFGQPASIKDGTGRIYASGIQYHASGQIKTFKYGNGVTHTRQLNARGLPAEMTDTALVAHRFQYDTAGNVTSILDLQQGTSFDRSMQYDLQGRLMSATSASFGGDHTYRYSYDANDNMLSATLTGVKDHRYWYDSSNRLTNVRNTAGATVMGLSYDVQGNLANRNGVTHTFDYGNRLRKIQGVERYRYDAHGRRVGVLDGDGTRMENLYSSAEQLLYEARRGEGVREHIYLEGRLIATRTGDRGTTVTYQHTDYLGSPVATSDAAGKQVERTNYEPYGAAIGKAVDGVGYTGHLMDATGLVYMQQRYQDPELGRFLSTDPVGVSPINGTNFNRYWYVSGSPYTRTDPDGRCDGPSTCAIDRDIAAMNRGDMTQEDFRARSEARAAGAVAGALIVATRGAILRYLPAAARAGAGRGERAKHYLPDSRAAHIFRDKDGHFRHDTPKNRETLERLANDPRTTVNVDRNGHVWSARTQKDGTQLWVTTRGNEIINGGINKTPRDFNPKTGLARPEKPKQTK